MKPLFKHSLALLPLLSILSMSPTDVHVKYGRSIASEEPKIEVEKNDIPRPRMPRGEGRQRPHIEREKIEIESKIDVSKINVNDIKIDIPKITLENQDKHPKLTEMSSRVDKEALKHDPNLNIEKLKAKRDELKVSVLKEKDEFKKGEADKELVAKQRKEVERLVVELLLVDGGLKDLEDATKIDPTEQEKTKLVISESEEILESLISELQKNEELVAKAEPKKEEQKPVVIAEKEPNKKEEVKKEIAKKDIEVKKDDKKDENCEQDKNLVMSKQLDALVAQQNQIMQSMLNMSQMMMMQSMMIQQQMMMSQMNMNTMGNQVSPYQYANQTTSGNWVYYPQGFQPNQQNIFQGQQQPMGQMGQMGMMPGQMSGYQPQSNWGLRPQMSFGEAAPMNGNFGFNMGGNNVIGGGSMVQGQQPQLQSPVAQPQLQQVPFQMPQQQGIQNPILRT